MIQTIDTTQQVTLDWAAKGAQRIAQNVLNIINTWRYEVAYDRTMGLNPETLDKPAGTMAALYTADLHRLIQDYEPRADLKSIQINGLTDEGNLDAVVVIDI